MSQIAKKPTNDNKRAFETYSIRAVEGSERRFLLSFSSEEPYDRYWGSEILDHSEGACDLSRLNEIGCLLFNHERRTVVGKVCRAWIENNRGQAEVEFDDDEFSNVIYNKVKNKTLKTTSVGYIVNSWEEVAINKKSSDGRFTGPCFIARSWVPYEISIVSVPADPSVGVGREHSHNADNLALFEMQLQINKRIAQEV